jgi:hypothetical protein
MVDYGATISWESVYKILHIWVDMSSYIHLFGVVYLASCNFVMDPTKEQRVCIKFCENLVKSAMETLAIIRQVTGEESTSS